MRYGTVQYRAKVHSMLKVLCTYFRSIFRHSRSVSLIDPSNLGGVQDRMQARTMVASANT